MIRNYTKLPASFYANEDVVLLARQLIGKLLITNRDGGRCSGRIIETEAYRGPTDKASHAYGGRRTARTEIMYAKGGVAYVYLCYGIHHLFNVVTSVEDVPHAILIRAIEPVDGKDIIMQRLGINQWNPYVGAGPGKVTKALGISVKDSGISLLSDQLYIADDGFVPEEIIATPRIGIDYAGEDALLPFRFVVPGHRGISAKSFTKKFIA